MDTIIEIEQTRTWLSKVLLQDRFNPTVVVPRNKPVFAVVDSKVRWFFDRYLNWDNIKILVIDGVDESVKIQATVNRIYNFLLQNQAERSSLFLAIGGGVLLDTAGFAASCYMRGMPWVGIPTTLLSQVDASIGGKTAINLDEAKNIIGGFDPPTSVLITPEVAETWNPTHRLEGMAEMYKIFRLFDHAAAQKLVQTKDYLSLLPRSVQLKAAVVRVDPWDKNLRGTLNLGHTTAHAIEHTKHLRHGLAVALGMRYENRVAERIGLMHSARRKQIDRDLDQLGFDIPTRLPAFEVLLAQMAHDKKNRGGKIYMTLIDNAQELPMTAVDHTQPVEVSCLEESYRAFCSDARITIE